MYKETLKSGLASIDRVVSYLTRTHGKGLRPILTLLCAKIGDKPVSEDAVRAAVIVELLHEATLVHDDVVDEARLRRGWLSLPAKFQNKVSVLFGDYMLANVLTETLAARDLRWLDILSGAARRMSRGELVQAARAKRLDLTEQDYMQMIADKTAALFSACCQLGALSAGLEDDQVEALGRYGEKLGVAFQIKDDLLDMFGDGVGLGKPVGGDLKERKLTLSLLSALENVEKKQARRIRARIRRGIKRGDLKLIVGFTRENGGEKYASDVMNEFADGARNELDFVPDSPVKNTLRELVDFMITRQK